MKSSLLKFRISSAHDERRAPSRRLQNEIRKSAELQSFLEVTESVEHALKQTPAGLVTPPSLHDSIMREVKNSLTERPERGAGISLFWRWVTVPGLAVVILLAIWLSHSHQVRPVPGHSFAQASEVLEMGQQMVTTLPASAVNPLASELQHLTDDLDRTGQFVLANLP
jgi:hypothetical protein